MVEITVSNEEDVAQTIQFAELDAQTNEIRVTDEAMSFLGSLPNDQKLAIVTIVGSIDSGKSFIANRILGGQNSFSVRSQPLAEG